MRLGADDDASFGVKAAFFDNLIVSEGLYVDLNDGFSGACSRLYDTLDIALKNGGAIQTHLMWRRSVVLQNNGAQIGVDDRNIGRLKP